MMEELELQKQKRNRINAMETMQRKKGVFQEELLNGNIPFHGTRTTQ